MRGDVFPSKQTLLSSNPQRSNLFSRKPTVHPSIPNSMMQDVCVTSSWQLLGESFRKSQPPGDSKWPFWFPSFQVTNNLWKGHVFTIPKRLPGRLARNNKNDQQLPTGLCWPWNPAGLGNLQMPCSHWLWYVPAKDVALVFWLVKVMSGLLVAGLFRLVGLGVGI